MSFLMSPFFFKILFIHKCNVQPCLFYAIFFNKASRYLMKSFRKFLTDLPTNYGIIKKMFVGSDLQLHKNIETKEF